MITASEAYKMALPKDDEIVIDIINTLNNLITSATVEGRNMVEYLFTTSLDNVTHAVEQLKLAGYIVEVIEKTDSVNAPGKPKWRIVVNWEI